MPGKGCGPTTWFWKNTTLFIWRSFICFQFLLGRKHGLITIIDTQLPGGVILTWVFQFPIERPGVIQPLQLPFYQSRHAHISKVILQCLQAVNPLVLLPLTTTSFSFAHFFNSCIWFRCFVLSSISFYYFAQEPWRICILRFSMFYLGTFTRFYLNPSQRQRLKASSPWLGSLTKILFSGQAVTYPAALRTYGFWLHHALHVCVGFHFHQIKIIRTIGALILEIRCFFFSSSFQISVRYKL